MRIHISTKVLKLFLLKLIILTLFNFCDKQKIIPPTNNYNYNYFPLEVGMWTIFDVTEITIDLIVGLNDTQIYQQMNYITQQLDVDGQYSKHVILTSERKNDDSKWEVKYASLIERQTDKLLITYNNNPVVAHTYPLKIKKTWDSNILNTSSSQYYKVDDIQLDKYIGTLFLDTVLSVTHKSDSSLIHLEYEKTKYAPNIGLVYCISESIQSQNFNQSFDIDINKPIRERIIIGKIIEKKIFSYGKD
jgi:hypothetical protein